MMVMMVLAVMMVMVVMVVMMVMMVVVSMRLVLSFTFRTCAMTVCYSKSKEEDK